MYNYNKINIEIFKNIIAFIKQELLKIRLRNYSREIDLIKILDAKLEEICQSRVSTILLSFIKNIEASQTQEDK